jgi:oligoribonuclease NrnB/cAMP/cGMP phosphodiesterase (DHH superfamily)
LNKVANAVQAVAKFRNGGRGHHEDQGEGGGEDDFEEFTKKLNWKSKAATDDIFDEEEKIQLGLRE